MSILFACTSMHYCVPGAYESEKRMSGPPEMELRTVVSTMWPSARAASDPNY